MALLCLACGNTFAADDRFCRVCGTVVGPVSPVAIANVPLTPAAPAQPSLVCGLFFAPLAFVQPSYLATSLYQKLGRVRAVEK